MFSVKPGDLPIRKFYGLMVSSVGPRPIALVSTISKDGVSNLTPFSCFNFFGANPPILVFSPMLRISDATAKDSLRNVEEVPEAVVNIVNYDLAHQSSLASTDYPEEVNEFEKVGLTMLDSDFIRPKRVAESPVQYECKVLDIIHTGKGGGAANLVICEVLKMHIDESVMFGDNKIDQHKLDQVARMGGSWYTRANMGMFELPKPIGKLGMGVDLLPDDIRKSSVLTGSDLAKLGGLERMPEESTVKAYFINRDELFNEIQNGTSEEVHKLAQKYLDRDEIMKAWSILLAKTL